MKEKFLLIKSTLKIRHIFLKRILFATNAYNYVYSE